jgi:hypothetical protein
MEDKSFASAGDITATVEEVAGAVRHALLASACCVLPVTVENSLLLCDRDGADENAC